MEQDWNDEKIFDEKIQPLVHQLREACEKHGLHFVLSVQYAQEGMESSQGNAGSMMSSVRRPSALMFLLINVLNSDELASKLCSLMVKQSLDFKKAMQEFGYLD